MPPMHTRAAGFTLIELLVAVAVLAILATLALPSFQGPMVRQQIDEWQGITTREFACGLHLGRHMRLAVLAFFSALRERLNNLVLVF